MRLDCVWGRFTSLACAQDKHAPPTTRGHAELFSRKSVVVNFNQGCGNQTKPWWAAMAAAWRRFVTPSLPSTLLTCLLTVKGLINNFSAISESDRRWDTRARTSCSRKVSLNAGRGNIGAGRFLGAAGDKGVPQVELGLGAP